MSFIDRLGETLKDVGWFIGAPVGAALDVAKSGISGDLNLNTAVKAVTTGVQHGTQLFTDDQNLVAPVAKPVGDALDWVYREGISRPINFANIEQQRVTADLSGTEDNASPMDFGSAWDRASNTHGGYAGTGTSIGREASYALQGEIGLGASLLGIDQSKAFSPLTDEGQKALNEGKGLVGKSFDIESGLTDAAARWYLDPTIIGGKLVKAARIGQGVAGLAKATDIEGKLGELGSKWGMAGWGERFGKAMDWAAEPGRSQPELVAGFPGLRENLDGDSIASVMAETNKQMYAAGKSKDDVLEQMKLIGRASTGDMGALQNIDTSVAFAKDALASMQSNRDDLKTAADWAVKYGDAVTPEMITEKARSLDLAGDLELRGRDYFTSDEFLKLTNARLQSVQKDVQAAEQEAARQQRIQKIFGSADSPTSKFGSLSDRPMLASAIGAGTKGLEKRAAKETGTYASLPRRVGEKALAPIGMDFVFQSTAWNKAIKVGTALAVPHLYLLGKSVGAFGRMAAPGVINVEDERAAQGLNTWLKHSAVDPETRVQLVSDLAKQTDVTRRGAVIEDAIQHGIESKISEFRKANPYFTDEAEKLVRTAINKQALKDGVRTGIQTQMFTAAKRTEDTELGAAGTRGDTVVGDDGIVHTYPLLPTQLTKIYGMPDLKAVDHILTRHSNWITDVAEWARGNRAPDPTRIQQVGEKIFGAVGTKVPRLADKIANNQTDELGQQKLNSVNDFAWKSEETAKLLLDSFNHIWKAGTLATRPVAYAMRVNVDSGMRFAAAYGTSAWMMHSAPRAFGFATAGTATGAKMLLRSSQDDRRAMILKAAMERAEDAWNASNVERRAAFDQAQRELRNGDQALVRYQQAGADTAAGAKPHGMYYSYNREGFKSPHAEDYGANPDVLNARQAPGAKVLEVSDTRVKHERFGRSLDGEGHREGNASSGVAALKALLPAKDFDAALAMSKEQLVAKLSREFPGSDYSKYYDSYELLEAYAGQLARRRGYDAISLKKPYDKQFDEYVALTDKATSDLPAYKRVGVESDPDYAAMKAEHDAIQARLHLYRTGGRKGRREAYGAFFEPGQKSIQTRAGEIEGAFSGELGRRNRWLASSTTSADMLSDSNKLALKDAQIGNWTYVANTDPNHMANWLHAVNAQLMQSDVGKQAVRAMVEHQDPAKASAQLARWTTSTPEGRKLLGELAITAADKRAYTNEVIGYVNHYLPSHDLRVTAAKNGRVSQGDLETAVPQIEDRPPVHGEALANVTNRGNALGKMVNNGVSRIMRWAGDATEDQLARHPMYAAVYEQEAKRRAEFLMADPRIEKIGLDQIRTIVQEQAHKKARQAVKNYMFDIAATSDLSHFMRFSSPFIAAWEDTVRKWGRLAKENPELIGKFEQAWNAPNAMGMVVDQDGQPVAHDGIFGYTDPKTGEHKSTYILIPRGLTKWIPGAGDSSLKISKQSLNIVLQGGLQPGFGPLIAYPVAKIQTAAPQLDGVAKFMNPYGPPKSFWDAVAPSTVKAITDAVDSQSRVHEQDTRRIWAQMLAEYRLDPQKFGGVQPTIDEAAKRAGSLGLLKIVNRVVGVPLPGFPATFQSPYQLYIDSYHALQDRERTEGHPHGWADDQFVSQFGDTFFPLVQSQSLNNGGVQATAEGVDASKRFAPLISKYGVEAGQPNANLVRLIVGQEGEGAYNDSAHLWQETHEISPASGVMYRSYENPQAAQAKADADLGWLKYRQKMQELDARAIQEGNRTYADDPDLVQERKDFITSLQKDNNSWYVDWSQQDNTKFTRDLTSLGEIANSGKFGPMRTDMVGVKQYLALRQAFEQETAQYGISPTSKDAQPFRQEFTDAVADLVSQNSQFAEWSYYTFLERDPYLEPVTTQGQPTDQKPTDWGIQ